MKMKGAMNRRNNDMAGVDDGNRIVHAFGGLDSGSVADVENQIRLGYGNGGVVVGVVVSAMPYSRVAIRPDGVDAEVNARIADFGMARLFKIGETSANASRMVRASYGAITLPQDKWGGPARSLDRKDSKRGLGKLFVKISASCKCLETNLV
ncbi:hypothetical protein Tco_0152908 [Tanacetum coccineum]